MTQEIIFMIYALIFRLGVLFCGTVSIVLGYKLYCKGLYSNQDTNKTDQDKNKTDIKARFAGLRLSIKNAGPGTIFALFGLLMIYSMIENGNPELVMEKYLKQPDDALDVMETPKQDNKDRHQIIKYSLRGDNQEQCQFCVLLKEADAYKKEKNVQGELNAYSKALQMTSTPLNTMANILLDNDKTQLTEALSLVNAAIVLNNEDAKYWDTKAKILFEMKFYQEALKAIQKAASKDYQTFAKEMPKYKKMVRSLKN